MDAFAVETDAQSLLFDDAKQQNRFELGVSLAVHSWATLETAVQNQWGGPESEDKRDWMAGMVVESFNQKSIDAGYIEELLLGMMQDEFESNVEDGSAEPVAQLVINIYQQLAEGDSRVVDDLYKKFLERKQNQPQVQKVKVEGDSDSESEDEDENDQEEEQEEKEKPGPVVDDDGFELVQRKKR